MNPRFSLAFGPFESFRARSLGPKSIHVLTVLCAFAPYAPLREPARKHANRGFISKRGCSIDNSQLPTPNSRLFDFLLFNFEFNKAFSP
jgi:hypothetical protein